MARLRLYNCTNGRIADSAAPCGYIFSQDGGILLAGHVTSLERDWAAIDVPAQDPKKPESFQYDYVVLHPHEPHVWPSPSS